MSSNNNVSTGGTQHKIAASWPSDGAVDVDDAVTVQDTKHVNGQDNKDNGKDVVALSYPVDGQDNNDNGKSSTDNRGKNKKQNKASRWKQMNKSKKAGKRQKIEQLDEKDKKPKDKWTCSGDDKTPAAPHEGSFAHEKMQKLFNLNIDVSGGEKDKGISTVNIDNAEDVNAVDVPASAGGNDTIAEDEKVPKRKLALLISFLGSNYAGFQINAEQRTLQATIELALYRAGIISKNNFGYPRKYGWSNSARTDKGVHAAAQCCSLKGEMIFHHDMEEAQMDAQMDAMREKVNEYLPDDVRILDVERVTRMFCARTSRDKVRYQYMVPSYMLCSQEKVRSAFPTVAEHKEITAGNSTALSNAIEDAVDPKALALARSALVNHRVTSEQMNLLKSGLKLFEGTHSFHNYTRRVGADNASATRYILSFTPLDPIIVPGEPDTQWIPLQVVGQSFLLNQIRKMVSAAVDLARGRVSEEKIKESFAKQCRMKINVAPAQGLFLDRSFFELYNKHKVKNAPKHGDSRDREILDWVEGIEGEVIPAAVRRVEEFKNEKIIPHIIREEVLEGNFLKYIYTHDVLFSDNMYDPIQDVTISKTNQDVDVGAVPKMSKLE